ncbi:MAG TPA: hypothetical protein O0X50_03740 [Methanocorpusculum sp.]|nr:hypothetical protein [Methanocorpusculum sp.]
MTGVLALVVLGCVIAAGCTSVPTAETALQTEDNPMAGQWQTICDYNGKPYSAIMILNPDGSAAWYTYRDVILAASSDYTEDTPGSMFFDEVWKATGDTTLTVQNMVAGALFPGPFQYVFDPVNQTIQELSDDPVGIFTRVDDIVGI